VIKRLFGEHVTSRLVKTQNRELSFRCIAYNTHRLTNLIIILVSTEPWKYILVQFMVNSYSKLLGTIILAELPNSLAIAVTSDTWRVERLFNFVLLLFS
jgi:hypothetical protein